MRKLAYDEAKKVCINAAKNDKNVLLIGMHGVGKTYLVQDITKELGLKLGYWSASTMDPYIDLVGVPYPESGHLKFAQREDIFDMEFLFFDELNRAHQKVRNSVLELIQFKSINGKRFPKLKMVWAAINPPTEEYHVEELDVALKDRFHLFIEMVPTVSLSYLKTKMPAKIAEVIMNWYKELPTEDRERVSPRRVEYIGSCLDCGITLRDTAPDFIKDAQLAVLEKFMKELNEKDTGRLKTIDLTNPKTVKNNFDKVIDSVWNNEK